MAALIRKVKHPRCRVAGQPEWRRISLDRELTNRLHQRLLLVKTGRSEYGLFVPLRGLPWNGILSGVV